MLQSIDLAALAKRLLAGGYTTKGLGEAIGLSQPAAWRLASGKTKDVSASVALRLIELAGGRVEMPAEASSTEVRDAA
jgi:plasmid maintenance system antidote protein VapI